MPMNNNMDDFTQYSLAPNNIDANRVKDASTGALVETDNRLFLGKVLVVGKEGGRGIVVDPDKGVGVGPMNITTGKPPFFVDLDGKVTATSVSISGYTNKVVLKTVTETVNNSAVQQNDDALFFALAAGESWVFQMVLFYINPAAGAADNLDIAITIPAAAAMRWGVTALATGLGAASYAGSSQFKTVGASGTELQLGTVQSDTLYGMATIYGSVANGANAGNLQLTWAQNAANATDTQIIAGSYLVANKV